jgi:hypothetical protein
MGKETVFKDFDIYKHDCDTGRYGGAVFNLFHEVLVD